jgi:stress response protein YsnF
MRMEKLNRMWRNGEVYKEYCVIIEYQLSVVEMRILK